MLTRKTLSLNDCDIKFTPNPNQKTVCQFSGYASVFNGFDSYGDTILPGAYGTVIKSIQAGAARMPKMFINHKSWDLPVGKWLNLQEDADGLRAEGELTLGNPTAQALKASMEHGTVDGLSIGFRLSPEDTEMVETEDKKTRLIKNISELVEISVVTFPADDEARVDLTSVKSALETITDIRDFEHFLRDAGGFSKSLAKAVASQARRIFVQNDSVSALELPIDLQRLIAANLRNSTLL